MGQNWACQSGDYLMGGGGREIRKQEENETKEKRNSVLLNNNVQHEFLTWWVLNTNDSDKPHPHTTFRRNPFNRILVLTDPVSHAGYYDVPNVKRTQNTSFKKLRQISIFRKQRLTTEILYLADPPTGITSTSCNQSALRSISAMCYHNEAEALRFYSIETTVTPEVEWGRTDTGSSLIRLWIRNLKYWWKRANHLFRSAKRGPHLWWTHP
jgi:hypothetical protein